MTGVQTCALPISVRYAEPEKLDRRRAPEDDRKLPDLHFGLYEIGRASCRERVSFTV